MPQSNRITLALRPREGEPLDSLRLYAKLGAPVSVGRTLGVITSLSDGDAVERALDLEEQGHIPAMQRVISRAPELYLQVAEKIRQQAFADGADEAMAEEAAGQAIRALVLFKQKLEKLLEPDLLTTQIPGSSTTENSSVVADSEYTRVRVKNIDEWIRTVQNAKRYEWLRGGYSDVLPSEAVIDAALYLARPQETNGEPV